MQWHRKEFGVTVMSKWIKERLGFFTDFGLESVIENGSRKVLFEF